MISVHTPTVIPSAAHRREAVSSVAQRAAREALEVREARIDEVVQQSFPASDPPSWNMGVADPDTWRA